MEIATSRYINTDDTRVRISFRVSGSNWKRIQEKKSYKKFRKIIERMERA